MGRSMALRALGASWVVTLALPAAASERPVATASASVGSAPPRCPAAPGLEIADAAVEREGLTRELEAAERRAEERAVPRHAAPLNALDDSVVPRVDLSWPEEKIVQAVSRAVDTGGFFYLINHGIPEEIFHTTIREAHRFFSQPLRKKLEISSVGYGGGTVSTKGYTHPGSEGSYEKDALDVRPEEERATGKRNTRESYTFRFPEQRDVEQEPYFTDYEEFLRGLRAEISVLGADLGDARAHLGHDLNRVALPALEVGAAARRFFKNNQWPLEAELPGFRGTVERYFDEMRKLADKTVGLFERVLMAGAGNSTIETLARDKGMMTFNLGRYGASLDAEDEAMGIVDHTDWELFTLLYPTYLEARHVDCGAGAAAGALREDCASLGRANPNVDPDTGVAFTGLEVWHGGGWVAVPRLPGAIIVNQGDMLSRLSGGRLKAPVHRVRARNGFDRYSLVSFWALNYDALLPDPDMPCGKVLAGEYYLKRNNCIDTASNPLSEAAHKDPTAITI